MCVFLFKLFVKITYVRMEWTRLITSIMISLTKLQKNGKNAASPSIFSTNARWKFISIFFSYGTIVVPKTHCSSNSIHSNHFNGNTRIILFPDFNFDFLSAQETKEKLVWIKSRIAIFRLHSTKSNWRERERDFFRVNDIKSPVMLHLSINQYLFVTYKILDSGNAECSNMVIFCTCSNRISIVERIQHNSSKRI